MTAATIRVLRVARGRSELDAGAALVRVDDGEPFEVELASALGAGLLLFWPPILSVETINLLDPELRRQLEAFGMSPSPEGEDVP